MDYTYFTFDGISSEYFNLIIQNNGQDLSYPSIPNFDNQIVSPLYQGTSYLAGVNKSDRIFNFNCWIDSIDNLSLRSMQNWLSVDKVGRLSLDYNSNFYYNVKIESISDFKHYAINTDGTSNYEFTLSFITLGDSAATSSEVYNSISGLNPSGFPIGYAEGSDLYFYNTYNLPFYFNFSITSSDYFTISKNDLDYYSYEKIGSFKIDSKNGFCLDLNNQLIESLLNEEDEYVNLGPLEVESNIHSVLATVSSNSLIFDTSSFTDKTRVYVKGSNIFYNNTNYNNIIEDFNLVENQQILLNYLNPTKITLTSGVTYSFKYRDNF